MKLNHPLNKKSDAGMASLFGTEMDYFNNVMDGFTGAL
jgi:hypothetical protein